MSIIPLHTKCAPVIDEKTLTFALQLKRHSVTRHESLGLISYPMSLELVSLCSRYRRISWYSVLPNADLSSSWLDLSASEDNSFPRRTLPSRSAVSSALFSILTTIACIFSQTTSTMTRQTGMQLYLFFSGDAHLKAKHFFSDWSVHNGCGGRDGFVLKSSIGESSSAVSREN